MRRFVLVTRTAEFREALPISEVRYLFVIVLSFVKIWTLCSAYEATVFQLNVSFLSRVSCIQSVLTAELYEDD